MRVGIVTGEYPPMQGGVGAYTHILVQRLVQQGHAVTVFSDAKAQNDLISGRAQHWGLNSLGAIARWAAQHQLELVSLQFQTAAFRMSPFIHFLPRWLRPLPVVTTFHDLRFPYLFPKAGPLRDWIVAHLARASAGVIVTNHEDLAHVRALGLSDAVLVPIGSNILTTLPPDFQREQWRAQAGAAQDDFLIAHFGFINRSKGLETLLESIVRLRDEGLPVKLVMIGGRTGSSDPTNAAYAAEIDQRINTLNLQQIICWTGFVDEQQVSAYLHASDIVTLPFLDGASYRRGSLMAAVDHGRPIITTQPPVEIPAFVHGENMLLTPPDDADALAEAVKSLYNTPALRQHVANGALTLRTQFDWTQIAHNCALFFEQILRKQV